MAVGRTSIRRWGALLLALFALALLALFSLRAPAPAWRSDAGSNAPLRRELPLSLPTPVGQQAKGRQFPPEAPQLQVGLQLKNVYNLQLENQTFTADGWYWLAWGEDLETILRASNLTPAQMVEFANQVEVWDSQIEPEFADPTRLEDGRHYQLFRFSARFYIDSLDEHRSPFETVVLPVVVEARPEQFALGRSAVRLRPAPELRSLTGDYSEVAGYSLKRNWVVEGQNNFDRIGPHQGEIYSQLAFKVAYGSEPWAAFMKWILPLLIVMSIVLLAPSLDSSLGDIRLAIPSTALLTLVFLQQTYKSELPSIPYLTFLDELYAFSYLVAVGLFVLCLWASNWLEAALPEQRETVKQRINRIEMVCQWGALVGFAIVALVAWLI